MSTCSAKVLLYHKCLDSAHGVKRQLVAIFQEVNRTYRKPCAVEIARCYDESRPGRSGISIFALAEDNETIQNFVKVCGTIISDNRFEQDWILCPSESLESVESIEIGVSISPGYKQLQRALTSSEFPDNGSQDLSNKLVQTVNNLKEKGFQQTITDVAVDKFVGFVVQTNPDNVVKCSLYGEHVLVPFPTNEKARRVLMNTFGFGTMTLFTGFYSQSENGDNGHFVSNFIGNDSQLDNNRVYDIITLSNFEEKQEIVSNSVNCAVLIVEANLKRVPRDTSYLVEGHANVMSVALSFNKEKQFEKAQSIIDEHFEIERQKLANERQKLANENAIATQKLANENAIATQKLANERLKLEIRREELKFAQMKWEQKNQPKK